MNETKKNQVQFEYEFTYDGGNLDDCYTQIYFTDEELKVVADYLDKNPLAEMYDLPEAIVDRFKKVAYDWAMNKNWVSNDPYMPDMDYELILQEEVPINLIELMPDEVQDKVRRARIVTKHDFFCYLYWRLTDEQNKALKEADSDLDFHFGLGTWLRNEFIYNDEDDTVAMLYSDDGLMMPADIVSSQMISEYQQFLKQYR